MDQDSLSGLSPEELYAGFTAARRLVSGAVEAEHAEGRDAEIRTAWLEARRKVLDRDVLGKLGLTHEELAMQAEAEETAYLQHAGVRLDGQPRQSDDPGFGLRSVPAPGTVPAHPYAVVAVGRNRDTIANFAAEASANPDAWTMAGYSERQEFFLDIRGKGTGLYDFSFIPEYNSFDWMEVQWYFLHIPFGDGDGDWSCSARPWLHGAYRVWSDDWFLTSRFASVAMTARLCLLPFGYPAPKYHDAQYASAVAIDEGGQNIDKSRWGGWLPKLAPLAPLPNHRQKAHWIIVSVFGQVTVRGLAHARLDFKRFWTSTGSKEGGSYRETKYGVYCPPATIHW